jgi:RraA family protein
MKLVARMKTYWRWRVNQNTHNGSQTGISSEGALVGPAPAADSKPLLTRPPATADLHPGIGFRVRREIPRPTYDVTKMFDEFEIADISDHLNRLYAVDSSIKCLSRGKRRLAGPACTVKVFPGDNLMVHKVLDIAKPGDVVVIDARGSDSYSVLGDTISMKAQHRGIVGFIVDGYVRDLSAIANLDYPVYARGHMPIGPLHRGPGEINYPVCCGGVVINPGDIVIGDVSGVVVLPRTCVEDLLVQLRAYTERNSAYLDRVIKGEFSNAWVDKILTSARCEIE